MYTTAQFLTLITLAKVSAPLQVSPQPVKLTDIIDKEFLMALHKTENDKKLKEILRQLSIISVQVIEGRKSSMFSCPRHELNFPAPHYELFSTLKTHFSLPQTFSLPCTKSYIFLAPNHNLPLPQTICFPCPKP